MYNTNPVPLKKVVYTKNGVNYQTFVRAIGKIRIQVELLKKGIDPANIVNIQPIREMSR